MRQLWLFLTVLALSFSGCQTPAKTKVWMEELEQEIRDKEDTIFDLEAENERLCKELDRAQNKLEKGPSRSGDSFRAPDRSNIFTPRRETPRRAETKPDELAPPMVEGLGVPEPAVPEPPMSRPSPDAPKSPRSPTPAPLELPGEPGTGGAMKGPTSAKGAPDELPVPSDAIPQKLAPQVEELDPNVNHIKVNPVHTTGYDVDGSPGDDGIKLFLEPRNKEERFVPLAAPVSIVVLDPAAEGDEQRLARWDFTTVQVDGAIQAALPEKGLVFQLPWTNGTPRHNKLKVCVRYAAPGGEKLETQQDVYIDLPGQISHRWTPASSSKRAIAADLSPAAVPASHESPVTSPAEVVTPPEKVPAPLRAADRRPEWKPFR